MSVISLLEIEETLKSAGPQKRHETLHAVTDMFLSSAPTLDEAKVELYDEVLNLLVNNSSRRDIADVSQRIAPIANAPRQLVRRFASDTDINVAAPVLISSPRLTSEDLCEIARSRGNEHLLAISDRKDLAESVTDILVTRGDQDVARAVAKNETARLSPRGIERLLERADADEMLKQDISARGIPAHILDAALAKVSARTAEKARKAAAAQKLMADLQQSGGLDDARIAAFAKSDEYDEVVAALALLSSLKFETVEQMMYPQRIGGAVLISKSVGLSWNTANAILRLTVTRNGVTETELRQAHREYLGLSRSAADRVIRFWHVRQAVANPIA